MSFLPEFGSATPSAVRPTTPAGPGHVTLLCATEPLDALGGTRLQERARPLYLNSRCLILDLRQAEYTDSAGVGTLLCIAYELEAQNKELRLVIAPGSRIERTLRRLHLLGRFRVFHCLEDAWTRRNPVGEPCSNSERFCSRSRGRSLA